MDLELIILIPLIFVQAYSQYSCSSRPDGRCEMCDCKPDCYDLSDEVNCTNITDVHAYLHPPNWIMNLQTDKHSEHLKKFFPPPPLPPFPLCPDLVTSSSTPTVKSAVPSTTQSIELTTASNLSPTVKSAVPSTTQSIELTTASNLSQTVKSAVPSTTQSIELTTASNLSQTVKSAVPSTTQSIELTTASNLSQTVKSAVPSTTQSIELTTASNLSPTVKSTTATTSSIEHTWTYHSTIRPTETPTRNPIKQTPKSSPHQSVTTTTSLAVYTKEKEQTTTKHMTFTRDSKTTPALSTEQTILTETATTKHNHKQSELITQTSPETHTTNYHQLTTSTRHTKPIRKFTTSPPSTKWITQRTSRPPCVRVVNNDRFCMRHNRGYYSHPTECEKYIVCEWGDYHECNCPPLTRWDGRACIWKYMAPCRSRDIHTTTSSPLVNHMKPPFVQYPRPPMTIHPRLPFVKNPRSRLIKHPRPRLPMHPSQIARLVESFARTFS